MENVFKQILFSNLHYPSYVIAVQDKQTINSTEISDFSFLPRTGRILALDLGTKRIGVAVCDELQITARPLEYIHRRSWKDLLKTISALIVDFDAVALVLGLPYNFDGSESEMSLEARRIYRNFSLSLSIPVFLQDERATSYEAKGNLWNQGVSQKQIGKMVDSEAAAIILSDFISRRNEMAKE